ncbi:hypothetical protein [Microvirga aerophila]|nr:hypothetical protein [Microvirga aerophila]
MKVTIGDRVRVHYHPPGERTSFAEGVVRRVDVATTAGRGFLIDITHDVVLGREQPVKPGYQHFVLYERPDDFPDRVEMLSQVQHESEPEPDLAADPAYESEPEPSAEAEVEPEPTPASKPNWAEHRGSRGLGRAVGTFFRRRA